MGRPILHDAAGFSTTLRAIDNPTGVPETGLNELTTGIEFYYWRDGASIVSVTPLSIASIGAAFTASGIIELNSGLYRVDAPSSACSAGASLVTVWGAATSIIFLAEDFSLVPQLAASAASSAATMTASITTDSSASIAALTTASTVAEVLTASLTASTITSIASITATEVWVTTTRDLTASTNFNIPTASAIGSEVWVTDTRALTDKLNFAVSFASAVGSVADAVTVTGTVVASLTTDSSASIAALTTASVVAEVLTASLTASTITSTASVTATEVWSTTTRALTDKSDFAVSNASAVGSVADAVTVTGIVIASITTDNSASIAALTTASIVAEVLTASLTASTITSTASITATEVWATATRALTDKASFTLDVAHEASIVDAVWDEVLTGATHNVSNSSGRRLRGIQEFQGYEDGAIWIDTVNGTAGTTNFENGTVENPVDTIADANTLATSLGINRFHIIPNSSITFAATQAHQVFVGEQWNLALGGQDISGTTIHGAIVSGAATNASSADIYFKECMIGDVTTPSTVHYVDCGFSVSMLAASSGDIYIVDGHSMVAGNGTPNFDFASTIASLSISIRNYSGGWKFLHCGASGTDIISLEGRGQYVLDSTCASGTLSVRGLFEKTDNSGGAVTINEDARYDISQIHTASLTASTLASVADAVTASVVAETLDVNVIQFNGATTLTAPTASVAPSATPAFEVALAHLYTAWRNKSDSTSSITSFYADDGSTVLYTRTVGSSGSTITLGEVT